MNELELYSSPWGPVADPIDFALPGTTWARCNVGIRMRDGSQVSTLGTSGSFALVAYGPCSDAAQAIVDSPILVPGMVVLNFAFNARRIVATPTSIVGAVEYQIVVAVNKN